MDITYSTTEEHMEPTELHARRLRAGLTQREVGEAVGVTQPVVSALENQRLADGVAKYLATKELEAIQRRADAALSVAQLNAITPLARAGGDAAAIAAEHLPEHLQITPDGAVTTEA